PPTILSYYSSCYHRDVHSFPTRRSSDLIKEHVQVKGISCLESRNIKFVPQKIKGRQHVLHIIFNSKGLFGAVFLVMNVSSPCGIDRKSTRLNSSHVKISYAVFCLKKKNK